MSLVAIVAREDPVPAKELLNRRSSRLRSAAQFKVTILLMETGPDVWRRDARKPDCLCWRIGNVWH